VIANRGVAGDAEQHQPHEDLPTCPMRRRRSSVRSAARPPQSTVTTARTAKKSEKLPDVVGKNPTATWTRVYRPRLGSHRGEDRESIPCCPPRGRAAPRAGHHGHRQQRGRGDQPEGNCLPSPGRDTGVVPMSQECCTGLEGRSARGEQEETWEPGWWPRSESPPAPPPPGSPCPKARASTLHGGRSRGSRRGGRGPSHRRRGCRGGRLQGEQADRSEV